MDPDKKGNFAFIKPGRAPSFGRGLLDISLSVIILIILLFTDMFKFGYVGYLFVFGAIALLIRGTYHLYNAFSDNRFSDQEIVAPSKENDPMDKLLGKNQYNDSSRTKNSTYERKYCPKCASKLPETSNYCSKCGNEI